MMFCLCFLKIENKVVLCFCHVITYHNYFSCNKILFRTRVKKTYLIFNSFYRYVFTG